MNGRSASSSSLKQLVLLAPEESSIHAKFEHVWRSNRMHDRLLSSMQRLRGRIYLEDGAITDSALSADGRHESEFDPKSWHLLTLNTSGHVIGCLRYYRPMLSRIDRLNVKRAALLKARTWCPQLHKSICAALVEARQARMSYIEIGGWALAAELRNTTEALRGVLATYAWSQHIGGALGLTTATERNGSRQILKRLGGKPLELEDGSSVPYYDQHYQCHMELLRFDSRDPNPKYSSHIEAMRDRFASVPVVCRVKSNPFEAVAMTARRLTGLPLWTDELLAGFV